MAMYWLIVLPTIAPLGVRADGLDDFSNNLATDLGPLIVLFGEAMTRQYLSECTSFLDYFIFAMAPIGVLTAMSSAIRVCGHSALRAFIGRSQEGQGAVEAELCTSTSRDVCELFNRGGITRVLGRPSILELVYVPTDKQQPNTFGLFSFRDWVESAAGNIWWKKVEPKTKRHNKPVSGSDSDFVTNLSSHPPNISLNVGIIKRSKWFFIAVAVTGFILQAGLIVLAGVGAWKLGWTKTQEGSPSSKNYAPIMYIIGTVLMSIGMWGCATVIGQTTDEVKYMRRPNDPKTRGTRLFWLQPGPQFIGDQCFDPFAYTDKREEPLAVWTSSTKNFNANFGVLSTLAVAATFFGYIMQFIGLRGMTAWLSLAQLAATIVMSMLRGALRAQRLGHDANRLTENPRAPDAVAGHELDWMAFKILKPPPKEEKTPTLGKTRLYIAGKYEQAKRPAVTTKILWHITGQYEKALEVDRALVRSSLISKPSSMHMVAIEDDSGHAVVEVNSSTQLPQTTDNGSKFSSASDKPGAVITPPLTVDGHHGVPTFTSRKEGQTDSLAEIQSANPNGSPDGGAKGPKPSSPLDLKTDLQYTPVSDQAECTENPKSSSLMDLKEHAPYNEAPAPSPRTDTCRITCGELLCIRSRLANLTGHTSFGEITEGEKQWKNDFVQVRSKAKQISSAICQAVAELRPKVDGQKDIVLRVIGTTSVNANNQAAGVEPCEQTLGIILTPPPEETLVGWRIDSARVEAILGLWMWSMISDGEEVKDVPVGNLKIPIEGVVSAGSDRQPEMDLWLGSQSVLLKEINCELRQQSYGLISHLEYGKEDKILQDPKEGTGNSKVRLCGWNPVHEAKADRAKVAEAKPDDKQKEKSNAGENEISFKCRIQTFPATGSLLDNCARELFVSLAASLTKIVDVAAPRIDAMENGGEVLLKSETVTILTRAFTANGLGTHAEALLSIIPTLLSIIPELPVDLGSAAEDKLLSTCIAKAGAYRRQKAWTRAERLLRWMCERYSTPDGGKSTSAIASGNVLLEKAVYATGELYRWSLREEASTGIMKGKGFGMDGIEWMAKKMTSSHQTIERILRNYQYVKTMMETESVLDDTVIANELLKALKEGRDCKGADGDNRCKTLYYLCLIKDCRAQLMQPVLRLATRNGWTEVALSIIEMGGNIHDTDMDGLTPLHWAAKNGDEAVTRELLENGAHVHKESNGKYEEERFPLHYAATNGHEVAVRLLLENGANVEAKGRKRKTALHFAAQRGNEAAVAMLLAKGADIESLTGVRQTPLLLATERERRAVVRLLLENGADVNAKNHNGETSLHLAASKWELPIVRLLLENGADTNVEDNKGRTPLHLAASEGELPIVRLLLENGADTDVKDNEGRTPLQVLEMERDKDTAQKEKYKEIIRLFSQVEK
ncbi:hypothetical protein VHEMI08860 [[Torrubiella] hemipterigena]|uniref:Uncharacterized protein n=1 Tax=[Torrubiella] hemipterigena TaxID=1531966 RepID=A0A0A1TP03_9HYPO|nr:hypothetical protein VHEMI08860 [[Torrubiella] hemipterigena]